MEQTTTKAKLTSIFPVMISSIAMIFKEGRWAFLLKAQSIMLLFALIQAIPTVVMVVIVVTTSGDGSFSPATAVTTGIVTLLITLILLGFMAALNTGSFVESYETPFISMGELIKKSFAKNFKFLGLALLFYVMTLLGLVFFVVPGVIIIAMFGFAMYALYEDDIGIIEALKRSKQLTSGYKWELVKKGLIVFLSMAIVGGVLSGIGEKLDSAVLKLVSFCVEMIFNAAGLFIVLRYYTELKEIKKLKSDKTSAPEPQIQNPKEPTVATPAALTETPVVDDIGTQTPIQEPSISADTPENPTPPKPTDSNESDSTQTNMNQVQDEGEPIAKMDTPAPLESDNKDAVNINPEASTNDALPKTKEPVISTELAEATPKALMETEPTPPEVKPTPEITPKEAEPAQQAQIPSPEAQAQTPGTNATEQTSAATQDTTTPTV